MPLSVGDLLDLPGLGLSVAAGSGGLDRPIRWAHSSELADPTRWLSGGEFLLTTGLGLKASPTAQRAYVNRLVKAGLAGLGFGLGFGFDSVPAPLARAADKAGFPVLEIPYVVPFIAITEAVSHALAKEKMRELEMSEVVHDRLSRLVGSGSGPADVLEEVVDLAPGWIYLFGPKGEVVASAASAGVDRPESREVWRSIPRASSTGEGPTTSASRDPSGSRIALPVEAAKRNEGLVVFGKQDRVQVRDRLVVRHAATLLGLLLASRRAVADVERRVAGDLLIEAVEGHVTGDPLRRRLELAGFPPGAPTSVLIVESATAEQAHPEGHQPEGLQPEGLQPEGLLERVEEALDDLVERSRSAVTGARVISLVVTPDPVAAASALLRVLGPPVGATRIGVGDPVELSDLRRSHRSASLALRAAPASVRVVTTRDLGAYSLLMESQPRSVLESFAFSVLGRVLERDRERGSELLPSIRAFVEAGGRWEEGAQALDVHRHTLRYRINQAQELMDRDLFSAEDRMEIWLACKALDLLGE